jgi:hypothetical protein
VRALARAAVLMVIVVVVVWMAFPSATVSRSQSARFNQVVADASADAPPIPHRTGQAADDTVDLYGNEVSDAFATYSLDPAGSLYETHSPQTELPRLASPKS